MLTTTPSLIDPLAPPEPDPRRTALHLLDAFCRGPLHPTVRRSAAWKGLDRNQIPDLIEDIVQELAVDVLTAPERAIGLPQDERHRRWMQIAERWIYQRKGRARAADTDPHLDLRNLPAPAWEPESPTMLFARHTTVLLANGRANVSASARQSGTSLNAMRRRMNRLAWQAGYGEGHAEFWRRRAAETLTGIAADLLRLGSRLSLLPGLRPPPDLRSRMRRLRRIRRCFLVVPTTRAARSMLRRWLAAARQRRLAPRPMLEDATELMPDSAAAWLWLFEACLADGDLPAAMRAVRMARRLARPTPRAQTLARARLLEARGQLARAGTLLQRASCRWPHDGVLQRLARELAANPQQDLPSEATSAAAPAASSTPR